MAWNTAAKSLDLFIENYEPTVAFKLIGGNISQNDVKVTFPHYPAMFI